MMYEKDYEGYADDPAFHEFVDREFDLVAAGAPLEDLAEFAFGGMEEAVKAFEEHLKYLAFQLNHQEDQPPNETIRSRNPDS
jgi:hypothetical protein